MKTIPVLDHGYVGVVEAWGSDERIIEAARMSTQKGFEGWGPKCPHCGAESEHPLNENGCGFCPTHGTFQDAKPGDEKLLAYLWKNKHATPFEMAGVVLEVQAPIFVFREWHRHRTQSFNEMSARYAPLPDLNYVPTVERLMLNAATANKQAGTIKQADALNETTASWSIKDLERVYAHCEEAYQTLLQRGVPKECARLVLPVGRYSRMRASANLRNWLGFLTLRMDKARSWEIREYASAVHGLLAERFPRTLGLFDADRAR